MMHLISSVAPIRQPHDVRIPKLHILCDRKSSQFLNRSLQYFRNSTSQQQQQIMSSPMEQFMSSLMNQPQQSLFPLEVMIVDDNAAMHSKRAWNKDMTHRYLDNSHSSHSSLLSLSSSCSLSSRWESCPAHCSGSDKIPSSPERKSTCNCPPRIPRRRTSDVALDDE